MVVALEGEHRQNVVSVSIARLLSGRTRGQRFGNFIPTSWELLLCQSWPIVTVYLLLETHDEFSLQPHG